MVTPLVYETHEDWERSRDRFLSADLPLPQRFLNAEPGRQRRVAASDVTPTAKPGEITADIRRYGDFNQFPGRAELVERLRRGEISDNEFRRELVRATGRVPGADSADVLPELIPLPLGLASRKLVIPLARRLGVPKAAGAVAQTVAPVVRRGAQVAGPAARAVGGAVRGGVGRIFGRTSRVPSGEGRELASGRVPAQLALTAPKFQGPGRVASGPDTGIVQNPPRHIPHGGHEAVLVPRPGSVSTTLEDLASEAGRKIEPMIGPQQYQQIPIRLRQEAGGELVSLGVPTGPGKGVPAGRSMVGPSGSQDDQALVARMSQAIQATKPFSAARVKEISKERGIRASQMESILESGTGPDVRRRAFRAAKGEIETEGKFEPIAQLFSDADAERLQEMIRVRFKNDSFIWMPTQTAFEKLFSKGIPPTGRELRLLEEVFGSDFVSTVLNKRGLGTKVWETFIEVWNVPKAIKASYDLSAVLRQGAYVIGEGNAAKGAFKAQLQSLRSEAGFNATNEAIVANPWYTRAVNHGLDMTLPRQALTLRGREEAYIGADIAEKIPIIGIGVKLSQRAYTAFLNKMRMDVFAKYAAQLDLADAGPDAFKKLAWNINIMTGRGSLGRFEEAAMLLNLPFFSPKFLISRIQLPFTLATTNPILAKMALRDFVGYLGFMFSMGALADFSGVAKVEWDPRSSDFGKWRIGNTRVDPYGGFQQPVVSMTQLLMGERKETATGEVRDLDPGQRIWQFAENKLSPTASSLIGLRRGRLFGGKELTPFNFFYEALAPMPIGDVWDAVNDLGAAGGTILGALGIFGVGIQTFGTPDYKEEFKPYFAVPVNARIRFRKNNPDIDAKLFITGVVTTVRGSNAANIVWDLVGSGDINVNDIDAVKDYVKDRKEGVPLGSPSKDEWVNIDLIQSLLRRGSK